MFEFEAKADSKNRHRQTAIAIFEIYKKLMSFSINPRAQRCRKRRAKNAWPQHHSKDERGAPPALLGAIQKRAAKPQD
jgi:hypothetical protein